MSTPISYKDAGVDIDAGDALIERIKPLAFRRAERSGPLLESFHRNHSKIDTHSQSLSEKEFGSVWVKRDEK